MWIWSARVAQEEDRKFKRITVLAQRKLSPGKMSRAFSLLGACDVVAGEARNRLHRIGIWAQPNIASLFAPLLGGVGLRQRD